MILVRMQPKDIAYWSKAVPIFREVLQPELPSLLFPEVFPILVKTLYSAEELDPQDNPELMKQHLNCRLVSKPWCQAIDQYLETQPCMERFRFGHISGSGFLKHFKETHEKSDRNPFVGRRVSVYDRQFPGDANAGEENSMVPAGLPELTKEIICTYGTHIMHLSCFSFGGSTKRIVDMMDLLKFTPNLVSLKLFLLCNPEMDMINDQEIDQIKIPKLKKLENINCVAIYPKVLTMLLNKNSHISRLSCGEEVYRRLDILSLDLPNLVGVTIECCTEAEFLRLENSLFPL